MVFGTHLTTEAEIAIYVGSNVHATADTEANRIALVKQAEEYLALIGKYDFLANIATLTALGKQVLSEYCARFVATGIIAYDGTAIHTATSLIEAENRITIHLYRMQLIDALISNQNYVKIITGV